MSNLNKEITADEFLKICSGFYYTPKDIPLNHFESICIEHYTIANGIIQIVSFNGYTIKGQLTFHDFKYLTSLQITNCIFEKLVSFAEVEFHRLLQFKNCVFKGNLHFGNPIVQSDLSIDNCVVIDTLDIEGGIYNGAFNIGISGTTEHNAPCVNVLRGEFKKLDIGRFNNTHINILNIGTLSITGNVFITNRKSRINTLQIGHLSRHLLLFLENFQVNQVSISGFTSSVKFKIHSITALYLANILPEFKIQNSNLGSAEISSVNLSEFKMFNIRDSYVSDTNFVNTIWPDKITSYEQNGSILETEDYCRKKHKPFDKKQYYFKNRDTYRQLKYASGKYGDVVMEHKFHALEMSVYVKSLHPLHNVGTWLILKFSELTSKYGQSILRPVFWLFCGHYLLFLLALVANAISYPEVIEYPTLSKWTFIQETIYYFFYLANPIRQYIFGNNWTITIDILMRIWSSYMIYNFIRASRRFIK